MPAGLAAQATVSGMVFDSTARVMLAGAVVQLARADAPGAPIAYSAQTDTGGRYVITGVQPGRYLAGFFHAVLDSLGVEPVARTFDVGAGNRNVRLPLAVPSARTIANVLCGANAATDSTSAVFGRLYDAETLRPVAGATVVVRWNELIVGRRGARHGRAEARGTTADDGGFAFCNAPGDAFVGLRAMRGRDTTGTVELHLRARGAMRRDLFVGSVTSTTVVRPASTDSARRPTSHVVRHGRAQLTGVVRGKDGRPINGARLRLTDSGAEALSNADGHFALTGVLAGTQMLEARALGFYPDRRAVDLVAGRQAALDLTLETLRSVMDTVRITAARVYSTDLSGFERRRTAGAQGRFFDQSDVELYQPRRITELLNRVPGVQVYGPSSDTPVLVRNATSGYCAPEIYIDRMRMSGISAQEIEMLVRPEELLGMEVYRSEVDTPAEFTRADGCGSILIWTNRWARRLRK
jgi:hypothetical protein